jgi:hypothetical protein
MFALNAAKLRFSDRDFSVQTAARTTYQRFSPSKRQRDSRRTGKSISERRSAVLAYLEGRSPGNSGECEPRGGNDHPRCQPPDPIVHGVPPRITSKWQTGARDANIITLVYGSDCSVSRR